MTRAFDRRQILASTSALALLGVTSARAQAPAPAIPPTTAPANTDWASWGGDLKCSHYAPLDQINAANFNRMEVGWRFKTDNFGPRADAYFNATPLVVKGRMYSTVGTER